MRVIRGGRDLPPPPPELRSITWGRLPRRRVALVIRDHEFDASRALLLWDDGDPYELVAIRDVSLSAPHVLNAWIVDAKADGLEIRDQRSTRSLEAEQDRAKALAYALQRERERRASRRGAEPPGGLFDLTQRNTRDLFNRET